MVEISKQAMYITGGNISDIINIKVAQEIRRFAFESSAGGDVLNRMVPYVRRKIELEIYGGDEGHLNLPEKIHGSWAIFSLFDILHPENSIHQSALIKRKKPYEHEYHGLRNPKHVLKPVFPKNLDL